MKYLLTLILISFLGTSCVSQDKKNLSQKNKRVRSAKKVSAKKKSRKKKRKPRHPAHYQSASNAFVADTGVRPGYYESTDDAPTRCLEGDVDIIENDETISLMIGGRLLVGFIKKGHNERSINDSACNRDYIVDWNGQEIRSDERFACGRGTVTNKKLVSFSNNKITYSIKTTSPRAGTINTECNLELRR